MIKDSILYVGGNKLKHWLGKKIQKIGNKLIENGKPKLVTNPSCKLINPFTLMIYFTVGTDKYQLVLQGDYKKHYKESDDCIPDIPEKEMFMIISSKRNSWFKKE
jgi:hypothetical protein